MEQEKNISPEFEKYNPKIRLEFFRHDEKGKANTSGDRTADEYVRLTDQGRAHSTEIGKTKNPHPEVAVAFGSPRERSVETSMRQMLANEDSITPETSLEEIRAMVNRQLKVGKKDKAITELNFDLDSNKQFHDIVFQHYLESKDALAFLYHDSDNLVKQLNDTTSTSYSRAAARFGEIVKKYLGILPRWKEITKENPERYISANNQMERYFGSHALTVELFLMKVMEKSQGPQAVEEFIKGPKKNGFSYSEGYTVTIEDAPAGPKVSVVYNGKTYELSLSQLEEIINEGTEK
jgi:hypothetical protein